MSLFKQIGHYRDNRILHTLAFNMSDIALRDWIRTISCDELGELLIRTKLIEDTPASTSSASWLSSAAEKLNTNVDSYAVAKNIKRPKARRSAKDNTAKAKAVDLSSDGDDDGALPSSLAAALATLPREPNRGVSSSPRQRRPSAGAAVGRTPPSVARRSGASILLGRRAGSIKKSGAIASASSKSSRRPAVHLSPDSDDSYSDASSVSSDSDSKRRRKSDRRNREERDRASRHREKDNKKNSSRHHRDRYSSPSDSSSSSDESDQEFAALESIGVTEAIADKTIHNILLAGPSVYSVYQQLSSQGDWSQRNTGESLLIARVIDELRGDRVANATELLVRRLTGVHTAETSGSWATCDAMTGIGRTRTFLPEKFAKHTIKLVNMTHTLNSNVGKRSGAGPQSYSKSGGKKSGNSKESSNAGGNYKNSSGDRRNDTRSKTESTAERHSSSNKSASGPKQ